MTVPMPDFQISPLLDTGTVAVRNVHCLGNCRHRGAEECAAATHLVFPYRGLYLRHVGTDQSVADANHVLLFSAGQGYQVSHPVTGGDDSLVLAVSQPLLRELTPAALMDKRDGFGFRGQSLRIDPRAQALVALLRHCLQRGSIEPLEAESLALTLVCRSLGPRTTHAPGATHARRRLVDRVKVLLAGDLTRRWSLAQIATEMGGSAVYLTQAFQQVEGLPLYRYHLRLRLARALDLVTRYDDMSALALDLGFSSHSHFTAAFKQAYGRSPSEFRRSAVSKSPRRMRRAQRHPSVHVGWVERSDTHHCQPTNSTRSRMTNYRRTQVPGATWFFTVNLAERRSRLLVERIDTLREALRYVHTRHPFRIEAMAVLPDHLHAVWTLPPGDADYPMRLRLMKSWFSRHIPTGERRRASRVDKGERGIWRRRYWEHLVRNEQDLERCVDCVHINPVKHGHAARTADWPYSTFHRYVAKGWLPADWGKAIEAPGSFGERDDPQQSSQDS